MIKNVYIYVSDDLRYDYCPEEIKNLGMSFKAVTQAPFSHPSFSTLVTGVYPDIHNTFNPIFDKIEGPTLFDLNDFNTGYYAESFQDSLYYVFD